MTSRLVLTVLTGGTPRIRLVTPAGQQIRELRGPTPNSWASDFDPTAQEVLMEVYERGVSDLYRLVIETGRLARVTTTPWNERHPSWSPDGRSLVFDTDSGGRTPRLTMLDLASGARSPLTRGTRPEQGASGRLTGIGWPSIATRGSRATRTTTCSRSIAQRDTKCASRTTWRTAARRRGAPTAESWHSARTAIARTRSTSRAPTARDCPD